MYASDGKLYDTELIHLLSYGNHDLVVSLPSGANVSASAPGQVFQLSTLFSPSDVDGDQLTYALYDATVGASTGHFKINGVTLAENQWVYLTQAQLAQTTFTAGQSGTDDILMFASDGKLYDTEVVHVSASAGQAPMAASLADWSVNTNIAGQSGTSDTPIFASDGKLNDKLFHLSD